MSVMLTFIFMSIIVSAACQESKSNASRAFEEIYVSREEWGGRHPTEVEYMVTPVPFAVMHHTVTEECTDKAGCSGIARGIQNFHIDDWDFYDIGYNFLTGGDGKVYEGTGWRKIGAHTYGYNSRSIGIGFIGNFTNKLPTPEQLSAAEKLLDYAVEKEELSKDYKLIAASQVTSTKSPGQQLYQEIKKWPHFTKHP